MIEKKEGLERLECRLANCWKELLSDPLTKSIEAVLCSGDRKLYGLWLCQVAHLTRHTSAHQALVGTRVGEISLPYAKYCFEHAAEEVGHEMMAVHDLRKIGIEAHTVDDLPQPLPATKIMTSYLYFIAERAHPATRLGFSYWAEKCYPYISELAGKTKAALALSDRHMSFFVSHGEIDEKHARDVERMIGLVCQNESDWQAVEQGMIETLHLAKNIFAEIYLQAVSFEKNTTDTQQNAGDFAEMPNADFEVSGEKDRSRKFLQDLTRVQP